LNRSRKEVDSVNDVRRIFVEKKQGFNIAAVHLLHDLKENLNLPGLSRVRIINRYDMAGLSEETYQQARITIFAEPNVDIIYDESIEFDPGTRYFAVESLPGQYDQRADSAAQCVQLLTQGDRPEVVAARLIVLYGDISVAEFSAVKNYLINPVDSREASLDKPRSLASRVPVPAPVQVLQGFTGIPLAVLAEYRDSIGIVMSLEDLAFCQAYFRDQEKRDPTITEMKAIDTYWSDHCRHTTFLTAIEQVSIEAGDLSAPIEAAYRLYMDDRDFVYGDTDRDVSLMDIAVLGMKKLRKEGKLDDLDISDEINACSIMVEAEIDGRKEDWLVMFKNETHNHPTEIEPFGGAATCLGGAIRDPLSGRVYVYQAMRVTGSGDPRTPVSQTIPGKLPQRKITTGAAAGYSSYGNQIGLATGQVAEVYDEAFVAKRMEIGAVIGAAPKSNVVRAKPCPGDAVLLLGGKTGRDGCGGATGSSIEHTEESILTAGAEVQKGNAPTERKIQRLFRNPDVSHMIKKCNDFGAGGVSVAIGELADGLCVDLDAVPKKYDGLDGTELAISESQERMAVVVEAANVPRFIAMALEENLEAVQVATVTDNRRLTMSWRGQTIVDISRDFLDTNGVSQSISVRVESPAAEYRFFNNRPRLQISDLYSAWLDNLQDLNVCSQRGMVECFDSTIGAATVLMPFGGKHQATPALGMAAKLPVEQGDTTTGTLMTYGYNSRLASWSPFHGALYAVIDSVAKIVAMGGDHPRVRLTLQEYFEKLGTDGAKWGKPFSALLGAYTAQIRLGIPAIGGKDSMSGTFKDLNVPPTLVSFAVAPVDVRKVISPEFKASNSHIVLVPLLRDAQEMPDFDRLNETFAKVTSLIHSGAITAAHNVGHGGIAAAISKMAFGNRIGARLINELSPSDYFAPDYGSLILEMPASVHPGETLHGTHWVILGRTQAEPEIAVGNVTIPLHTAQSAWEQTLEAVFPTKVETTGEAPELPAWTARSKVTPKLRHAKPRVLIPVFPGTNCEYDTARRFAMAGADPEILVFRNLSATDVEDSVRAMTESISKSQIIALPGGFSAGDEPEGSGKFIATVFRNPRISEAVMELLQRHDGLMLGICNGFQALIKLGLLPYGEIRQPDEDQPTLTFNQIGRHVSCLTDTKVVSVLSPWFAAVQPGDIYRLAMSHGEGRFVASREEIQRLSEQGQIAAQYVDEAGRPTLHLPHNPNGSYYAVEALTSPDGRILGKMGHSERIGTNLYRNVPGEKDQRLFESGVNYFRL
jgi:phosphoribosylformylglycinamidine synthase